MLNKLRKILFFSVITVFILSGLTVRADATQILIKGTDAYESNIDDVKSYDTTLKFTRDESQGLITMLAGSNTAINNNDMFNSTYPDGIWFEYSFECEKEGVYQITLRTGKDNGWESNFSYGIDDEIYIFKNEYPSNTMSQINKSTHAFYITEGTHTFTYTVKGIAPAAKRVYANLYYAQLDRCDIEYVENLIENIGEVTIAEKSNIENARAEYDKLPKEAKQYVSNYEKLAFAEKVLEILESGVQTNAIVMQASEYASKSANFNLNPATATVPAAFRANSMSDDGISATYEFVVIRGGTYRVDLSSAVYNSIYMSPYAISVDGGKKYDINSDTVVYTQNHTGGGVFTEYLRKYQTNLLFDLEPGLHTVTVHITGGRTSDSQVITYFEYIKMVLDEDVTQAEFETENLYGEIGESIKCSLKYTGAVSGENIAEENLSGKGAEVSYSSSNGNVVLLDDGSLSFNGLGESEINAIVSYRNYVGTANMKARTTVDGLFIFTPEFSDSAGKVTELKNASGSLKVKAKCINVNNESKTVWLVLAIYENGVLKTYKKQSCAVTTGECDIETEITDFVYSEGMSAELFIWGDENIPKLVTETSVIS